MLFLITFDNQLKIALTGFHSMKRLGAWLPGGSELFSYLVKGDVPPDKVGFATRHLHHLASHTGCLSGLGSLELLKVI